MDAKVFLARALNPNVPPSHRFYQLANAVMLPLVSRPLNIVHVVEFPKCGGSWIRNMVRRYLGSPPYYADRFLFKNAVIHTHRLYSRTYRRPVVVVRDPRDLYASMFHHQLNFEGREKPLSVEPRFELDPDSDQRTQFTKYLEVKLLKRSHPWFFFSEFLGSWMDRPGVCVVRYEDFLDDPHQQLVRILRFIGEPIDLDRVQEAVDYNSFENQTKLRYGQERKQGETDEKRFLRKGVAGDWRNHFSAESARLLELMEGPSLRRLGYERDGSWVDRFVDEHLT